MSAQVSVLRQVTLSRARTIHGRIQNGRKGTQTPPGKSQVAIVFLRNMDSDREANGPTASQGIPRHPI